MEHSAHPIVHDPCPCWKLGSLPLFRKSDFPNWACRHGCRLLKTTETMFCEVGIMSWKIAGGIVLAAARSANGWQSLTPFWVVYGPKIR